MTEHLKYSNSTGHLLYGANGHLVFECPSEDDGCESGESCSYMTTTPDSLCLVATGFLSRYNLSYCLRQGRYTSIDADRDPSAAPCDWEERMVLWYEPSPGFWIPEAVDIRVQRQSNTLVNTFLSPAGFSETDTLTSMGPLDYTAGPNGFGEQIVVTECCDAVLWNGRARFKPTSQVTISHVYPGSEGEDPCVQVIVSGTLDFYQVEDGVGGTVWNATLVGDDGESYNCFATYYDRDRSGSPTDPYWNLSITPLGSGTAGGDDDINGDSSGGSGSISSTPCGSSSDTITVINNSGITDCG